MTLRVRGEAHSVINHYKYEALKVKNPKAKDIKKYEEYIEFKKKVKSTDIAKAILNNTQRLLSTITMEKSMAIL